MANYFRQPVQGFQTGGRASSGFGLQSAGIKTQRDLEAQANRQAEKQGKWGMWGNLLGTAAGLAGSYFLPGLGGPFANKLFGKALSYALPKALTKAGVTSTYNPETYGADALFGKDKYADLTSRGEKFKSRGYEAAGVGMLTDIGTAMMPSPFTGKPAGSFGQQLGIEPAQWGAQLHNQIPTSASVYQNFGQNVSPGFQLGTDFRLQGGGRVPSYYAR